MDARELSLRLKGGTGPYAPAHLKIGFDEFEHGFVYKRVREGSDENDPCGPPARVPVRTLFFSASTSSGVFRWTTRTCSRSPGPSSACRRRPSPTNRRTSQRGLRRSGTADGRWITSHVINQDIVAWVGQGRIADRTKESLGASDRGISLIRSSSLRI